MKQRLKGLLALVLSLTMVFALATNAWAVVRIGGQDISENTYWTYSDNAWSVGNDQSYNVHLSNNTLTLNEFVYNGNSNIYSDGNLTLNLIGNNAVTYGESGAAAVHVTGNLTIKGDNGSSLTVSGTYSITDGIHADNVTIESGTVTATGGEAGISANNNVVITNGTVTAKGDTHGLSASNVNIEGGTVTATGDEGRGIYTKEGNVTISGGTVKATGKTYGIFADKGNNSGGMKVTISGGGAEAYATDGSDGIGIYAADGEIAISGTNTEVTVGCATGLKASTVNILENSTVTITTNATTFTDGKTIDCTNLYFDADTSKLGTWYQWSENGGSVNISSNTNQLTVDAAKGVQTLTIEKISTGSPGTPQPPSVYYPIAPTTPEPEGDKVTSSKTFDGGIASAVVVSILSATGGAWLAKKKD